jgi:hypothetical protein
MSLTKVTNSMILGSYANAADYGMDTGASADVNCAALQAALLSGNTVVVVPPGNYSWNPRYMLYNDGVYAQSTRVGVSIPSGVTLLGYGVTLTSINTNSEFYGMLASYKTTGVNIKGFTLIGDRDSNGSNPLLPNDFGFGIDFRDVTNASVEDVISNKMWGDSFYLGVTDVLGTGSSGVTYRNIIGINSRRQGLSITGGNNIIVDGYRFEDIVGAAAGPCAGIDIEPNTGDFCDNIQILNGYVSNSNQPVLVFKTINLIVNNLQSDNNAVLMPRLVDRVYDACISNVVSRGGASTNYGVLWQLSRNLENISIENCQIGTAGLFQFFMSEDTTGGYDWYNVVFSNCVFLVRDAAVNTSYFEVSNYGQLMFEDCKVIVPITFGPADAVNLTSGDIIFEGQNAIWKNCTITNLGTASLVCDFGSNGNYGNVINGMSYVRDTLAPQNSWVAVPGFAGIEYIKDSSGLVHIQGALAGGTVAGGTQILAQLPGAYRPSAAVVCPIVVNNGGTISCHSITISNIGGITLTATIPGNTWISLNGVTYAAP